MRPSVPMGHHRAHESAWVTIHGTYKARSICCDCRSLAPCVTPCPLSGWGVAFRTIAVPGKSPIRVTPTER